MKSGRGSSNNEESVCDNSRGASKPTIDDTVEVPTVSLKSLTYKAYKALGGQLTSKQFSSVKRYTFTQDNYSIAFKYMREVANVTAYYAKDKTHFGMGYEESLHGLLNNAAAELLPPNEDIDLAAKVIGVLGPAPDTENSKDEKLYMLKIFAEVQILQGIKCSVDGLEDLLMKRLGF
jgi:hypothetical protein